MTTGKFRKIAGAAAIVLGCGLQTVSAQEAGGNDTQQAPAWRTQCAGSARTSAALECSMEQRLVLEGGGQLLARMLICMPADTKRPVYMIQVPLGIALPVGLRISVDGAPGQNLGFQTCDQAGCYVGEPFPDDLLSAMKAGNVVSISFEDNQKRPIKLDFSLKGFTKALTDISPA